MGLTEWWNELLTGRRRAFYKRIVYDLEGRRDKAPHATQREFYDGFAKWPGLQELHQRIYRHYTQGDVLLQEVNPTTLAVVEHEFKRGVALQRAGEANVGERTCKIPVRKGHIEVRMGPEGVTTSLIPKPPKLKTGARITRV